MDKVRAHLLIGGRVQGVFYRRWTKNNAEKLGLSGWVRNLSDGRVEAAFEGAKNQVEEMVTRCRKGPKTSDVQAVEVQWKTPEDISGFEIKSRHSSGNIK
jgi:acylphosphatase